MFQPGSCCSNRKNKRVFKLRLGERIRNCHVPDKSFSWWARYECGSVWPFFVDSRKSHLFNGNRYLRAFDALIWARCYRLPHSIGSSGIHVFATWTGLRLARSETSRIITSLSLRSIIGDARSKSTPPPPPPPTHPYAGMTLQECMPGPSLVSRYDSWWSTIERFRTFCMLWFSSWYCSTWKGSPIGHSTLCITVCNVGECRREDDFILESQCWWGRSQNAILLIIIRQICFAYSYSRRPCHSLYVSPFA